MGVKRAGTTRNDSMSKIKSVLVTGAGGKLGAPLCEALVAAGYHVLAGYRRLPVGVDGVEEVKLDVADEEAVDADGDERLRVLDSIAQRFRFCAKLAHGVCQNENCIPGIA